MKIELHKAKERLRHKRDVILGRIRQPGFEIKISVLRSVRLGGANLLHVLEGAQ